MRWEKRRAAGCPLVRVVEVRCSQFHAVVDPQRSLKTADESAVLKFRSQEVDKIPP